MSTVDCAHASRQQRGQQSILPFKPCSGPRLVAHQNPLLSIGSSGSWLTALRKTTQLVADGAVTKCFEFSGIRNTLSIVCW